MVSQHISRSVEAISIRWPAIKVVLLASAVILFGGFANGQDLFHYKDGRVLAGKYHSPTTVEVNGKQEKAHNVILSDGIAIRILDKELKNREEPTEFELKYAAAVTSIPNTIENQLALARDCSGNRMREMAEAHFYRVLDLDADHSQARAAVDFKRDERGQWAKVDRIMTERRGKIRYKGKWEYPEKVIIEQARDAVKSAQKSKIGSMLKWHIDVVNGTGKRRQLGYENIQSIEDPAATEKIAELLLGTGRKRTDKPTPLNLKLLYINLLAKFQTPAAARVIAAASVNPKVITGPNNNADSARTQCLNALDIYGRDIAIQTYLGYLASNNRELIKYAAMNLAYLRAGDAAVLPLIAALSTQVKEKTGGGANTYSPNQGMTLGGKEKVVLKTYNNERVLGALQQITNQNYDYDRNKWYAWYASVHAAPADDLRRDP